MKIILTTLFALNTYCYLFCQAYPDRHNTSWNDAWISCQTAVSPNILRNEGHWIMYDLGDQYSLHESTIWNNNVPGETDRGLNEVVIDYSKDGSNWIELGTYILAEGPGSSFYQGDEGPDFDGVNARYILISAISNHGGDCYSLSEIRINAAISTSSSFYDNELDLDISLSPNPATDFSVLILDKVPDGNVRYQITDMNGKLIKTDIVTNNQVRINTSELVSGIYTVTVHNEKGIKSISLNVSSK